MATLGCTILKGDVFLIVCMAQQIPQGLQTNIYLAGDPTPLVPHSNAQTMPVAALRKDSRFHTNNQQARTPLHSKQSA